MYYTPCDSTAGGGPVGEGQPCRHPRHTPLPTHPPTHVNMRTSTPEGPGTRSTISSSVCPGQCMPTARSARSVTRSGEASMRRTYVPTADNTSRARPQCPSYGVLGRRMCQLQQCGSPPSRQEQVADDSTSRRRRMTRRPEELRRARRSRPRLLPPRQHPT